MASGPGVPTIRNKTEKAALSASRRREKLTWQTKITLDDKADDYLHMTCKLTKLWKIRQNSARFCKILQDSAKFCKILQDSARLCKTQQYSARFCKILQESAITHRSLSSYHTAKSWNSDNNNTTTNTGTRDDDSSSKKVLKNRISFMNGPQ